MKTSQLISPELDYWVSKAEGRKCKIDAVMGGPNHGKIACQVWVEPTELLHGYNVEYSPSSNWLHGGPIIEHERITVQASQASDWRAFLGDGTTNAGTGRRASEKLIQTRGETPLIAAMRAYIANKFGDEVPAIEG